MSKHKRRSERAKRQYDFHRLEDRRLLALGTCDDVVTSTNDNINELTQGTSLILNGDFSAASNGTAAGLFDQADVPDWNVVGGDEDARLKIFSREAFGGNVLALDSTDDNFDQVFQDVQTEADTEYLLSFESISRNFIEGQSETSYSFEVFWDGESVATIDAQSRWETTEIFVTGDGTQTRLEFREVADDDNPNGDGRGPLLDDIRLVEVSSSDLIGNNSFESFNGAAGLISADNLDVWNTIGGSSAERQFRIIEDASTSDGDHFLDLDSSSDLIDLAFQTIDTQAGSDYFLTFDLRSGDGTEPSDNELRVRFDNDWAGTFQATADWEQHTVFVQASTDLTRVVFREAFADGATEFGSGSGPQIDNVRLFEVGLTANALQVDLNGADPGRADTGVFIEDAGEISIAANDLTLVNEQNTELNSAEISIDSIQDAGFEVLDVTTTGTNISSVYDSETGVLSLTGDDSLANYQTVLRSLTYDNSSQSPTESNRQISLTISSDDFTSAASTIDLDVVSVNDAPILSELVDVGRAINGDFTFQANAFDLDNTFNELTFSVSATGTAVEGDANQPTIDSNGQISWTPDQLGDATITVTATDAEGAQTSTDFEATIVTPFLNDGSIGDLAPELRNDLYFEAPPLNIDLALDYEAVIELEGGGELRFELFDNDAPITVNSFINLARDGFYDGLTFHRVVDDFSARVAQGGDPTGLGTGGPGYTIPLEVSGDQRFDSAGVLGKARAAALDSGGSQFFITLADQDSFTNSFTVFGNLISDQSVLEGITMRDPNTATTPGDVIQTIRIEEV